MIDVTLEATVIPTTAAPPYRCIFSSSNTCVSFVNPVVENIIAVDGLYKAQIEALYNDTTCFSNAIITATFTDVNGCSGSNTVIVNNPCASLSLNVTNNGEFEFIAVTTGGTPGYTYTWSFDTALFSTAPDTDVTDDTLNLNLINTVQPETTTISCTVKDINGCETTSNYTYVFCKPTWSLVRSLSLTCKTSAISGCSITPVSQRSLFNLNEILKLCSTQSVDWSTLTLNYPASMCVVHDGAGRITIASSSTFGMSAILSGTVRTVSGITSEPLEIVINVPQCGEMRTVGASNGTTQLTANNSVGMPVTISTSSRIAGSPDYSTMQIVTAPTFGTALINPNGDIEYTPTDLITTPNVPDIIKWSIQSTSGKTVFVTETILRDIIAAPVIVNDQACATCGNSSTATDVMANDTGDVVRDTITITSTDPDIVVTKDSDNNLIFTALVGASFANQVKYTVDNSQGVTSNEGTIFVSAACTGTNLGPANITCLPSKVIDIRDYFQDRNSFGDSYIEDGSTASPDYTAQGGTITGAAGTLDFSAINNGIYRFKYTASNIAACAGVDDEAYLTVIHNADPTLTITTVTTVATGVYQIDFTYASIVPTFTVTDNGSPASFQSTILASGGTGQFTLYSTAGNTIVISATTVCGTNINDTTVLP